MITTGVSRRQNSRSANKYLQPPRRPQVQNIGLGQCSLQFFQHRCCRCFCSMTLTFLSATAGGAAASCLKWHIFPRVLLLLSRNSNVALPAVQPSLLRTPRPPTLVRTPLRSSGNCEATRISSRQSISRSTPDSPGQAGTPPSVIESTEGFGGVSVEIGRSRRRLDCSLSSNRRSCPLVKW